jgi:hypothetical protein
MRFPQTVLKALATAISANKRARRVVTLLYIALFDKNISQKATSKFLKRALLQPRKLVEPRIP